MKHLWREKDGPMPKREGTKHADPLDKAPEWMEFKSLIFSGKMKPMETIGYKITDEINKLCGVDASRVAGDRLKRMLKDAGLKGDYHVRTDEISPGYWFLRVTYEPPLVAGKKRA